MSLKHIKKCIANRSNIFSSAKQIRVRLVHHQAALGNKVALVTGSTSGIGLGIAAGLASRGCHIVLNGFADQQLIQNIKDDFKRKYGVQTDYVSADLSQSSDIATMWGEVKSLHPAGVDILVNNAGFQHVSPVEEFADEMWERMVAVMLSAPFYLIKKSVPDMKRAGWGRIINISSVHGLKASPNKSAYVSCKHGIIGLTKVIGLEMAGSGVTCNAICPGYADTPILREQVQTLADREHISYDEAKVKFLSNFHATGQPVGIDQIADAVCFLCSDSASQMTGSNMVLDGGWAAK